MKSLTKAALVAMVALVMGLCFSTAAQADTVISGNGSFSEVFVRPDNSTYTLSSNISLEGANGTFSITGTVNLSGNYPSGSFSVSGSGSYYAYNGFYYVFGSVNVYYSTLFGKTLLATYSVNGFVPLTNPTPYVVPLEIKYNSVSVGSGSATITYYYSSPFTVLPM